jgi:hypothetical protein
MNGGMHKVIVNMYQVMYILFSPYNNGVGQGGNVYPFHFSLFLNYLWIFSTTCNIDGLKSVSKDLEQKLFDILLKLFIILYSDDTVLTAESATDLQKLLDSFTAI